MRIQRFLTPALLWALFMAPAFAAETDSARTARQEIQAAYRKLFDSFARKDLNAFLALHAPDYVETHDGRRTGYADLREGWAIVFQIVSRVEGQAVIQSLKLNGDEASVRVKIRSIATGPDLFSGEMTSTVSDLIEDDVWVRGPSGWLLRSSEEVTSRSFNTKPGKAAGPWTRPRASSPGWLVDPKKYVQRNRKPAGREKGKVLPAKRRVNRKKA